MIFYNIEVWLAVDYILFSYLIKLFPFDESEAFTELDGLHMP